MGTYAIVDINKEYIQVKFYSAQNYTEIPYDVIDEKTKSTLKDFKRMSVFHV